MHPIDPESFGERLRATRERRGWCRYGFAHRVGVAPTTVWRWEANDVLPRLDQAVQIALVLGVSVEMLAQWLG